MSAYIADIDNGVQPWFKDAVGHSVEVRYMTACVSCSEPTIHHWKCSKGTNLKCHPQPFPTPNRPSCGVPNRIYIAYMPVQTLPQAWSVCYSVASKASNNSSDGTYWYCSTSVLPDTRCQTTNPQTSGVVSALLPQFAAGYSIFHIANFVWAEVDKRMVSICLDISWHFLHSSNFGCRNFPPVTARGMNPSAGSSFSVDLTG